MRSLPASRYLLFFVVAIAGLAIDLGSKHSVFSDLGYPAGRAVPLAVGEHEIFAHPSQIEGETKPFLDGWVSFRFFTSFNEGALWGFGQGWQQMFVVLAIVAVIGVMGWLFAYGAAESAWLTFCLALIMAGTLGNLYDRLGWHGYVDAEGATLHAVRDFMLFTFARDAWAWPVFNFADVFLVTGSSLLVLQSLLLEFGKGHAATEAQKPSEESPQESTMNNSAKAQAEQKLAG